MKLNDLIVALAGEIEAITPQLQENLDILARLDIEEPEFAGALEVYSSLLGRLGEAAEMVGLDGLQMLTNHITENAVFLASFPPGEREEAVLFLQSCPELLSHYLHNIEDPSVAAGIVDWMQSAPSPMDEKVALKVVHMLGSIPAKVQPFGASDPEELRPVLARPEDVVLNVPEDVDLKLMEGFFQEAPEQTAYLLTLAKRIVSGEGDESDLIAAKRTIHTLKGTGALIGLRGIASLGHHLEDILDYFERDEAGNIPRSIADVLLDSAYCLEQMVGFVTGSDDYPEQALGMLQSVLDIANLIDRGESLEEFVPRSAMASAMAAPPSAVTVAAAVEPEEQSTQRRSAPQVQTAAQAVAPGTGLRVNLELIEELFRVSGEISVVSAALEAQLKALSEWSKQLNTQNRKVQERMLELENLVDVRGLSMLKSRTDANNEKLAFDPLEMDQYSELHSTTHALAEEASDTRILARRLEEEIAAVSSVQTRQQILSRELQHLVVGTRMTEVGVLETRLQRNVRTTAQTTGKEAEFELIGGDTLIDTNVLNRLAEPLLHILRNAVDHGLESPDEREKAGKPRTGRITLTFALQGQQIHLRCEDDGRGLDLAAIYKSAVKKGVIEEGTELDDDGIARLILEPEFSSRDSVTEVSGRGIGLDVVHEWVKNLNGSIHLESEPGQGLTIDLFFAASLATVHSLIVEVSEHRFSFPTIRVERAVPRGVGQFEKKQNDLHYHYEGDVFSAAFLADLVGLPVDGEKSLEEYDAVMLSFNEQRKVVAVDSLVDARELLIKNPGRFARHIGGLAGLSILGDGRVSVNLDVQQLFAEGAVAPRNLRLTAEDIVKRQAGEEQKQNVLIVDDALSVRTSLKELLEDAGFATKTAIDGVGALEAMDVFRPNIVLTDMEMPNMNGIELTRHIKSREEGRLPVIMITSRSLQKHRELAEEAGVDTYITKPYSDADLIRTIRKSLAKAA